MRTVGACGCSIWCCPERCAVCEAPGRALCDACRAIADETRASGVRAVRCARPVARASLCRVLGKAARVRRARARRSSTTRTPGRSFGRGRSVVGAGSRVRPRHSLRASSRARSVDGLVPVPGDPERAWQRGDVPARGLATELARIWDVPVVDVLERSRALPRQRGLSLDERRRNVRGSVSARVRGRAARLRRGRRLHVRRDRRRLRVGVPTGRSEPCRGDHACAGRPLD